MCGRYTLSLPGDLLADELGLAEMPEVAPRYNIAPTQEAPVVRVREHGSPRELHELRWGLVPHWADDPSIGNRLINARSETVHSKPSFRDSFARRRCIVPADGFYEWLATDGGKQPFHVRPREGDLLALAGLWSGWRGPDDEVIRSYTIITCPANDLLRPIHDRMPAILPPEAWEAWLDPEHEDREGLRELLGPCPDDLLEAAPVSTRVNTPANDDERCVEPVGEIRQPGS